MAGQAVKLRGYPTLHWSEFELKERSGSGGLAAAPTGAKRPMATKPSRARPLRTGGGEYGHGGAPTPPVGCGRRQSPLAV
jgi:hypothetical protein